MSPPFDPKHHHRRSIRLDGYDYTQPGHYFITICTYQKIPIFGEITDGEIHLSPQGKIALREWLRLPARFPLLRLGVFAIMPDHLHGLLAICEIDSNSSQDSTLPIPQHTPVTERFGKPVRGSIPTIVRAYKSAVATSINRLKAQPGLPVWQRNYYERVIRGELELKEVEAYILNNPLRQK